MNRKINAFNAPATARLIFFIVGAVYCHGPAHGQLPDAHLDIVATTGGPATGGQTFVDLGTLIAESPVINDRGQVLFVGFTGTAAQPFSGLYLADTDRQLRRVAGDGDVLPGAGGLLVGVLTSPGLDNDDGIVAATLFVDELFNPFPAVVERGVILEHDGAVQTLARDGQPTPAGGIWGQVNLRTDINTFGDVLVSNVLGLPQTVFMFNPDMGSDTVFLAGVTTPIGHRGITRSCV